MARYKPSKKFITPLLLYRVTEYKETNGIKKPVYASDGILFYGSFATYGGTNREINGIVVAEDTAVVETWFRPEFTAHARVALANDPSKLYEIEGEPENIEQRNLYTKFRLARVRGAY